jgi:hypothetical protein
MPNAFAFAHDEMIDRIKHAKTRLMGGQARQVADRRLCVDAETRTRPAWGLVRGVDADMVTCCIRSPQGGRVPVRVVCWLVARPSVGTHTRPAWELYVALTPTWRVRQLTR